MGNFSEGSECYSRDTKTTHVYSAPHSKLACTKTHRKNCIMLTDSTPCGRRYSPTMHCPWATRRELCWLLKSKKILNKSNKKILNKYDERKNNPKISSSRPEEKFQQGQLLVCFTSRPGQWGLADGHVLEAKKLEVQLRKSKAQKGQ